jgi:transporter family-2 protein
VPEQVPDSGNHVTVTNGLFIAVAVCAGMINALQIALLGGVARDRGAWEATWISMLASLLGMAVILAGLAFSGTPPTLRLPFGWAATYVVFAAVLGGSLLIAGAGLPPYLLLTGLAAIPYLLAASLIGPRLGLAVFFASIVSGQLIGSVVLDHIGAFGTTVRPVSLVRLIGIGALLLGVVLIRGTD